MQEKKSPSLFATIVRLGIVLLAVAAVVALVLGLVNAVTAGRIAQRQEEKLKTAMQTVLYAESYVDLGYSDGEISAMYDAEGAGWVVEVTETGSQGEIGMIVGVSYDYSCTGISITSSSETAGLGAIAAQNSEKGEAFRAQFVGQSSPVAVTKSGGSIDAISGATITSAAVCKGVTAALDACVALNTPMLLPSYAEDSAPVAVAEPAAQTAPASQETTAVQSTPAPATQEMTAAQTAPAQTVQTADASAAQAQATPAAAASGEASGQIAPDAQAAG